MCENVLGAGNQQERQECLAELYIAGFVDGEGTFHIAFQKAPWTRFGWQIIPEFRVNQHEASRKVIEMIQNQLNCGHIKMNHTHNKKDHTIVLAVRNREDLLNKVIPFFEQNQLHTEKRHDFEKFRVIVKAMAKGEHLSKHGFEQIVKIAFTMNAHGSNRKYSVSEIIKKTLESSETIRLAA